jgi:hypothetical protein
MVKRRAMLSAILLCCFCAIPLRATSSRAIVRVNFSQSALNTVCASLGCNIVESIGDPQGEVFLVTSNTLDQSTLIKLLLNVSGVLDCEPDQLAATQAYTAPAALTDTTPITYYGATVPHGYVNQPATTILRLAYAQSTFQVSGAGTVAVIDTGVDPNHPALAAIQLKGYDFTRKQNGAYETKDVT